MTLMRFDPFREFDRLAEQALGMGTRSMRSMPLEALRRGEELLVYVDLPGVASDDTDVTVERNVVSIKARRTSPREEGDEVFVDERPHGEFTRQLFLGDNLDAGMLSADMRDGVLTLRIPVAEESKPRRVELGGGGQGTAERSGESAAQTSSP